MISSVRVRRTSTTAGWLTNVKGMIGLNADAYVTGHGDVLTKADLQRKYDATSARRAKIAAMIKEKKSLADIKAALPDAPAPGAPARGAAPAAARQGGPPPVTYVDIAYAELTKK